MECPPEIKEPEVRIEYSITQGTHAKINLNPIVTEHDNSIYSSNQKGISSSSCKELIESLTSPSRQMFLNQKFDQIRKIYFELDMKNPQVAVIAFNIIQSCVLENISDVVISKTGDKELLLYRNKQGAFSNLLIDEDGDVSYMFIGKRSGEEKTEFFPNENSFDYTKFAALL